MTRQTQFQVGNVQIEIEDAPEIKFPGGWFSKANINVTDCNSPCWWSGGTFYILNSAGDPWRSFGPDVTQLPPAVRVTYTSPRDGARWIESVHQEPDGTLLGWYHNEPQRLIPEHVQQGRPNRLTAPSIGAALSRDNGATWDDLGILIEGAPETLNYDTHNFYFAGGNGDFSVILDRQGEYFYFLMGTYYRDVAQQGVALARMRFADRANPVGTVSKWHNGAWQEPGLGGRVTPSFPVRSDWNSLEPDALWGPSVHYNTHLEQYVILMNRAINPRWKAEGVYLSLNPDIADPHGWSEPLRILDASGWYPQVIGCDTARHETDRLAGRASRLFIAGKSNHLIRFSLAGE
jgi:hypothetical protein